MNTEPYDDMADYDVLRRRTLPFPATATTATTATKPTTKARKPRPARVRTVELVIRPDASAPGAVTIRMGKLERTYLVTPLASDFGRCFRVERLDDGTVYDVCLDGMASTCECLGFQHHRKPCKHILTLAEMVLGGLV